MLFLNSKLITRASVDQLLEDSCRFEPMDRVLITLGVLHVAVMFPVPLLRKFRAHGLDALLI